MFYNLSSFFIFDSLLFFTFNDVFARIEYFKTIRSRSFISVDLTLIVIVCL